MSDQRPDTFRQIYAILGKGLGPRKIVMDVYEDGYTPFDVVSALVCFTLDNPDVKERFRAYVQSDAEENERCFTGAEAEEHLKVLLKLLITVWESIDGSSVYITGNKGWVN